MSVCKAGEATLLPGIEGSKLQREAAVRICLGDAATGNSGMLELMQQAPEVLAVEGCFLQYGTEIMRVPAFKSTNIEASGLSRW